MIRRRPLIAALSLLIIIAPESLAAEETPPAANDEFLAKLRARDQKFDNVHLVCLMRGTSKFEDHSWKLRNRRDGRPRDVPAYREPFEYKYVHRDEFIIRGDDITHISNVVEPAPGEHGLIMMRFTKTTNIGGVRTELNLVEADSNQGFMSRGGKKSTGFIYESMMRREVEFALGFGYGRRLTKIESVTPTETGFHVTGRIKLDTEAEFPCTLEVVRDMIVRRADVDARVHQLRYTSKGSQTQDGFTLAESGRVRRFNTDDESNVDYDYFVIFQEAHLNLTDERYRELTTIDVPPGVDPVISGVAE